MTMRERTAYPSLQQTMTVEELTRFFTPTAEEKQFVNEMARGESSRLQLMVYLKCFQRLGYLPQAEQIPQQLFAHLAQQINRSYQTSLFDQPEIVTATTRFRYRRAIHRYLNIKPYRQGGVNYISPEKV